MSDKVTTDGANDGGYEKHAATHPKIAVTSTRGGDTNDWPTRYELRVTGH